MDSLILNNIGLVLIVIVGMMATGIAVATALRSNRDLKALKQQLEEARDLALSPLQRQGPDVSDDIIFAEAPSALYLNVVTLLDIRCFRKLRIEFGQTGTPWLRTAVMGDNSVGKSTLLRAIALALCSEGDAIALMKATPGRMIREGEKEGEIRLELVDQESGRSYRIVKTFERNADGVEVLQQKTRPPGGDFPWSSIFLCGYGTQRTAAASSSFDTYSPRLAVSTLFDVKAVLQNPEVVLLRQPPPIRNSLMKKLQDVMLLDTDGGAIAGTKTGLTLRGPWGAAPFDELSDGYRSTMQWLLDLFAWMMYAGRFPAEKEPAGILLIDEIEQHLHPRWQRHIIRRLSRQLPRMQIITTTHTPLIASSMADVKSASLLRLYKGDAGDVEMEIIETDRLQGKRADQVLTEFFDLTTSRNPGSSDDLTRYAELRSKTEIKDEEQMELTNLTRRFDSVLRFGESDIERKVEQAVSSALDELIQRTPEVEFNVEAKRQLRALFPDGEGEE